MKERIIVVTNHTYILVKIKKKLLDTLNKMQLGQQMYSGSSQGNPGNLKDFWKGNKENNATELNIYFQYHVHLSM